MGPTLERLGVRYLIVHRGLIPGQEVRRVQAWIARGPLRRVYRDELIDVYEYRDWQPSRGRR